MKKMILSMTIAVALSATTAFSQGPGLGIGVMAVGLFPVGDYQESTSLGFGGLGGIEIGDYPGLSLTARSGYIQQLEQKNYTVAMIPILGGLKASTMEGSIYMTGEFGVVKTRTSYSGPLPLIGDNNETNPAWGFGVGSMAGPWDLRLSFNVWDARHTYERMSLGLSLGFLFRSL